MMTKHTWKMLALTGVAALGLTLTACYVPPDDLGGSQNISSGNQNAPFATVNITAVPTQTPTPPMATNPPQATINWNDTGTSAQNTGIPGIITAVPGSTGNPQTTISITTPTLRPISTNVPTNTPAPTASSLKKGASGASVRTVQQRLKDLGYLKGSVDGDFGDATEDAVKAFQKANGLTADGKVGQQTLKKLNSSDAKHAAATPKPTKKPTPTPKPTKKPTPTPKPTAKPTPKSTTPSYADNTYLESGMSGKKTRSLQNRLIELGWLGGSADGSFGGATEAALRAFQSKTKGLWADGVAGPETLTAIYASNAAKSSTPVAVIGVKLTNGDKGGNVRALQSRLKDLGYLTGSVDGTFGAGTEAAVIAFQYKNGLKADGIAGTGTLNTLFSQSAVKSNGTGPSTDPTPSGKDDGVSSTGYVTLSSGDKGTQVRKLQEALKNKGFYSGSVDGTYGNGTLAAVMAFQSLNDLTVDGKAGPATQRVLYNTGSGNVTYTSLHEGMKGEAVRTMQYTLYELGYYFGSRDGDYGSATTDAVKEFQYNNGLTTDGKAGNATLQKLYSASAKSATSSKSDFTKLSRGAKGEQVLELKDALMQYGYLASDNGTNIYDADTENAVRDFQRAHGLTVDGIAGEATQTLLYFGHVKHK